MVFRRICWSINCWKKRRRKKMNSSVIPDFRVCSQHDCCFLSGASLRCNHSPPIFLFFQDFPRQPDIRNVVHPEVRFSTGFFASKFAFAILWSIMLHVEMVRWMRGNPMGYTRGKCLMEYSTQWDNAPQWQGCWTFQPFGTKPDLSPKRARFVLSPSPRTGGPCVLSLP